MFAVIPSTSDHKAVGAAEVDFDTTLEPNQYYRLTSTTAAYVAQGAAPVAASAADGSFILGPNESVILDGDFGAKVSIIQVAAGGFATLTRLRRIG